MRKIKRLTQQELASIFNVTQNTYSYWENGKVNLDNATLGKLAAFYNVSIEFLLGDKFEITRPISQWHSSEQEEYNEATPLLKEYLAYKYGRPRFLSSGTINLDERTAVAISNEQTASLTAEEKEWLEVYRTLNNEQKQFYLAIAKMNEDEIDTLNKLVDIVIEKKQTGYKL